MKLTVLGLAGSPRRNGNTETLLDRALAGAESQGALVDKVVISRLNLAPCRGCERCNETGRCIVRDDYQELYERLIAAERIIVASPIYFTSVTAYCKALIDRCQCLWARRFVLKEALPPTPTGQPRKGAFLSTAGDARQEFACATAVVRGLFSTLRMAYADELLVNALDERGAVQSQPELLERAFQLGARLAE